MLWKYCSKMTEIYCDINGLSRKIYLIILFYFFSFTACTWWVRSLYCTPTYTSFMLDVQGLLTHPVHLEIYRSSKIPLKVKKNSMEEHVIYWKKVTIKNRTENEYEGDNDDDDDVNNDD